MPSSFRVRFFASTQWGQLVTELLEAGEGSQCWEGLQLPGFYTVLSGRVLSSQSSYFQLVLAGLESELSGGVEGTSG